MDIRSAALVVVDAQNGFLNGSTRTILPMLKQLCTRWLDAHAMLVFTRYHNYPDSPFERLLHWYKLRDAPDTDICAELQPFAARATVVEKLGYTALVPELEKLIVANDLTDVVICGLDTETCVLKTAVDTFEHGLTPWLIADACASNGGDRMHKTALRLARRFIGAKHIIDASDLEAHLSKRCPS